MAWKSYISKEFKGKHFSFDCTEEYLVKFNSTKKYMYTLLREDTITALQR